MSSTHSVRRKYILAGLLGAVAGGFAISLTTLAVPKIKSAMIRKCKQMMAEIKGPNCEKKE